MDYAGAKQAYTESSILTAPPERLVVMLYDGAIRFITQGAVAMRRGDRQICLSRIRRAEAIIDELNYTLDMTQGDVAVRLRSIYVFSKRHLREAILKQDPDRIDSVARLLSELRQSWQELAARGVGDGHPAASTG
jgi:flagellar secretion chaperone FliS